MRAGRRSALVLNIVLAGACLDEPPGPLGPQGVIDASSADGPLADAPPGAEACFEAFGHMKDYHLCSSDGMQCEFYVDINADATCMQLCNSVGRVCVESYDSSRDLPVCTREEAEQCMGVHTSQICICEL